MCKVTVMRHFSEKHIATTNCSPLCYTVDMRWNTGGGLSQAQESPSREAEAAVSTERRWQSSLCRRGTSGSRKLEWSSLCRASSSTLSPGRICRAWRKSKSLLCHRQPEWDKRTQNVNENTAKNSRHNQYFPRVLPLCSFLKLLSEYTGFIYNQYLIIFTYMQHATASSRLA